MSIHDTNMDADMAAANEESAMHAAMRRLMGSFATAAPQKAVRRQREKAVRATVDGRTLRAKGRTAQLNIKVTPELKEALQKHVERQGIGLTDWMENTLRAALGLGAE
jgi:hypothetical protein